MSSGTSGSVQIAASMCLNGLTNCPLFPITPMKRAPSLTASMAVMLIARAASLVRLTADRTLSIPLAGSSVSNRDMLRSASYPAEITESES